jgi:gamma-glutamyltranspeptidase/glutathione hydrolase
VQGVVAAGHPVTAEAGADVLRAGGNAVDAAVAASLASWVAEPLLTGPGAGGYLMVAGPGVEPTLLDFFVSAPADGERAPLIPVDVSFGDANQLFHVGASSVGVYGTPAGLEQAITRWGSLALSDLTEQAARGARRGVQLNKIQAYIVEILADILTLTPEIAARFAPAGRLLVEGETFCCPELAETIERFGADGAAPFYTGDIAAAAVSQVAAGGGTLSIDDLAAYRAEAREPVAIDYRGRTVLTNPPPSAGGILIAAALAHLAQGPPPDASALIKVMGSAQAMRTSEFDLGLAEPGFLDRFLAANLGSTTHISVLDQDGLACSLTCTNGEGSGIVVPGTGIHLNNIMGEEDLNPQGFFKAPPGRRMPSMMAPTVMLDKAGDVQMVIGSAGSNRIRSAILQSVLRVVDEGCDAPEAVHAPRLHLEGGTVYAEPGSLSNGQELDPAYELALFREQNLFFGGVQAVCHDPATGAVSAAGDPRRGGAVAYA